MSNITTEGFSLLARQSEGKFVFTRATLSDKFDLEIQPPLSDKNVLRLTLRATNTAVYERIFYDEILVYAKIEGDDADICYASIKKSSYIPTNIEMPEFVEDTTLGFTFADTENVVVNVTSSVFALKSEIENKPDIYLSKDTPPGDCIWLRIMSESIADDETDVVLELTEDLQSVNVEYDGNDYGVSNAEISEDEPSEIIIK